MTSNGTVRVTRYTNPVTGDDYRYTYEWEGGAVGKISNELLDALGLSHLRSGDLFNVGQFRLVLLKENVQIGLWDFVRVQYPWDVFTLTWLELRIALRPTSVGQGR